MFQRKLTILLACLVLLMLAACAQAAQPPAATVAPQATAATDPTAAPSNLRSVTSSEFGLSLSYDPALAQEAVIQSVEPVPLSPDRMFAEAHPGYIRVTFPGYALAQVSQLPYPIAEPQVMVFRTADFASYGTDTWSDFPSQQKALESLLAEGLGAERCTEPPDSSQTFLPYLPWTNAAQVFCAQAKELAFGSGKGIRYLTSYSQGIEPVVDPVVFYTFQGLTDDGLYYISAVFPVDTSVFPDEIPQGSIPVVEEIRRTLANQITMLNGQPADAFYPALDLLDGMLETIQLED